MCLRENLGSRRRAGKVIGRGVVKTGVLPVAELE
jgi:hypothetical protein